MGETTKNLLTAAIVLAVVAYPVARVVGFTSDMLGML